MNNALTAVKDISVTMSTLDIAEQTSKEHFIVMRDVRNMLAELEIPEDKVQPSYYTADNGKEYMQYHLDHDLTLTLVSGYSTKLRHAVVRRWRNLETQQSQKAIETHPKYSAKWVCRTAVRRSITPAIKQTLALFEQRYPQSVRRQRDDFLLAPFLAYELAEQLIHKAELNYEQREKREEATEKQWQKLCEGKEEIRAFFKQDPDVAMLTRRLTDEQLLERFNQE